MQAGTRCCYRRVRTQCAGRAEFNDGHYRSALTLVELIVAIGIAALLLALAVPGIQSVRETSRRAECATRQGQLVLAGHAFENSHGYVPTTEPNPYWKLLPFLDSAPLKTALEAGEGEFQDSVFCCPSDNQLLIEHGYYNYLMNGGTLFRGYGRMNGFMQGFTQGGDPKQERRLSDITDGLSQTAAFSERLHDAPGSEGTIAALRSPGFRLIGYTPRVLNARGQERQFADLCRAARIEPVSHADQTTMLRLQGSWPNCYDHLLAPNTAGCANGPESGFDHFNPVTPATSLHSGGVNVAYADGHTDFASESIDVIVWGEIGTAFELQPGLP